MVKTTFVVNGPGGNPHSNLALGLYPLEPCANQRTCRASPFVGEAGERPTSGNSTFVLFGLT
jgi:hypothetical protein